MTKQEISIPKGCKKVEIDHENGVVIMHVEEEKVEFKRGDIITDGVYIMIFDKYHVKTTSDCINIACFYPFNPRIDIGMSLGGFEHSPRHATTEEAKLLFDKLEEEGYKWNAETLELEKIEKFEKGELVLIRDTDREIWQPAIFHSYDKENDGFSKIDYDGERGELWNQCTKFDPELMGTTNKPTIK